MSKYLFLIVFSFVSVIHAQSFKEIDFTKNYLKSKKKFIIKPNIDCYTVDTCFIKYGKLNISVIRAISEKDKKKAMLNNNVLSIISLYNQREDLTIENIEYPDYENSEYYLLYDKIYIINTIPFCTGLSCRYRYVQIIDIKNKTLYEKKIKWDK